MNNVFAPADNIDVKKKKKNAPSSSKGSRPMSSMHTRTHTQTCRVNGAFSKQLKEAALQAEKWITRGEYKSQGYGYSHTAFITRKELCN